MTCYFFNQPGGCTNDRCSFQHVRLSNAERNQMVRPGSRGRSHTPAPAEARSKSKSPSRDGSNDSGSGRGRGKGKGGKGKGKRGASPGPDYCRKNLTPGGCPYGDSCRFVHMARQAVDALPRGQPKVVAVVVTQAALPLR